MDGECRRNGIGRLNSGVKGIDGELETLYLADDPESYPLTDKQMEAVSNGEAWLLTNGRKNNYILVKITVSEGEKSLFIWHANGIGWVGIMDTLESLAKSAGATSIKFGTSRRGWERRAKNYGFTQEKVVYSREVKA